MATIMDVEKSFRILKKNKNTVQVFYADDCNYGEKFLRQVSKKRLEGLGQSVESSADINSHQLYKEETGK